MKASLFKTNIKRIHFIGIGGSGMSGIAEVLLQEGFAVSGSDQYRNAVVDRLQGLGVQFFIGHQAQHVETAQVVVVSSAIAADNPELLAAKAQAIPVIPRALMLAELMRFRQGVAIAGTHGKTTTTSLVASVLAQGGLDPTFVVGGLLNSVGSNARLGTGDLLVAEADESDASFLHLDPMITVITNVDRDHLSHYNGDFEKLKQTFVEFAQRLPFYGLVVACQDCAVLTELLPQMARPIKTYGFAEDANYRIVRHQQTGLQSEFTLRFPDQSEYDYRLNIPGKHNISNAAAAIVVAETCRVSRAEQAQALAEFQGVGRRTQVHGQGVLPNHQEFLLIEDYGHHPREIEVTIQALRDAFPDRRIVMAFQPHRYTRTHDLFDDFATQIAMVDMLFLLEVYSAGESPIVGAESRDLARTIRVHGRLEPFLIKDFEQLIQACEQNLQSGDILLMQGAGSIGKYALDLKERYCRNA